MTDCDIQEPEDDDMSRMYKLKAAVQISKAIEPQQILKVYDALWTELKLKMSEKKIKPSHVEKAKYESLLAQTHTKVSSQKWIKKKRQTFWNGTLPKAWYTSQQKPGLRGWTTSHCMAQLWTVT